jgi:hypothetical protein
MNLGFGSRAGSAHRLGSDQPSTSYITSCKHHITAKRVHPRQNCSLRSQFVTRWHRYDRLQGLSPQVAQTDLVTEQQQQNEEEENEEDNTVAREYTAEEESLEVLEWPAVCRQASVRRVCRCGQCVVHAGLDACMVHGSAMTCARALAGMSTRCCCIVLPIPQPLGPYSEPCT